MKTINCFLVLILFTHFCISVDAKVQVHVMNMLAEGRNMTIHCRSKDDDLGYIIVKNGQEMEWDFNVNVWGTTLFFCDAKWSDSFWNHFDAYNAYRDYSRCKTECRWIIEREETLLGYNQDDNRWEIFSFTPTSLRKKEKRE